MASEETADYVAAAIAYALLENYLHFTSDVRSDFQDLLFAKYEAVLPREVIVPALRILHKAQVIVLDDDRYRPLVHIPSAYRSKVGVWRFLEINNPAAGILNRFMDGPHDWMKHLLQSEEFNHDLIKDYGLLMNDIPKEINAEQEQDSVTLSTDSRASDDLVEIDNKLMSPQIAHVLVQNSVNVPKTADLNLPHEISSTRATWTSAWAAWISALIGFASLALALHVAKVF